MSARKNDFDDEDLFAHTRMSLGDHIEELRGALWRAIKGFLLAMILGFFLAEPALHFISRPIETQLMKFYERRVERKKQALDNGDEGMKALNQPLSIPLTFSRTQMREKLGLPAQPGTEAEDAVTLAVGVRPADLVFGTTPLQREVNRPPALKALSIQETFMVWMKVAIYLGIVLASPWIFYQIWMFVAAGLYPQEKVLVHRYLPLSILLFLSGAALCQFIILPIGIDYLLRFNEWLNIEPDLRLSEWLSFAIIMPLAFGVSFQTPLAMFFIYRLGIVEVQTFRTYRKIAIFVLFVLSALLVASGDPFSMMGMAIPLCLLYELGIVMCMLSPRQGIDLGVEESEETVEV